MRALRSPLVLLLAIVLLRSPGFFYGIVDIDECDFILGARMMTHGSVLYAETVEKKPPLAYALYALFSPLGFEIWPMQIVAIGWLFATAWVTGRAARRLLGRDEAGPIAAWLALLVSSANVLSVNCELLLNLPSALAFLAFARAEDTRRLSDDALAGLMIGVASLFKHQGGILLPALGLAILIGSDRRRLARLSALVAGFGVPWLGTLGLFFAIGHAADFIEWNFTRNFLYAGGGGGGGVDRFLFGLLEYVVLGAPLLWLLAARRTAECPRTSRDLAPVLAAWLTWIPVSLGGRFYDHYFIQFAPALALAATPGALWLFEKWPRRGPIERKALVVLLVLPVLLHESVDSFRRFVTGRMPCDEPKTQEVAAYLRASTRPDETVFVWGHYTPIYYLAKRLPGTRYIHTSVHMGDFDPNLTPEGFDLRPFHSKLDVDRTIADLEKNQTPIVVDTATADIHAFHKVPLESFPELDGYIRSHYALIGAPAGARVYRRNGSVTR